jgi:N-acetyl-anhydromuramyl-L-alanine amidase AmpD
MNIGVETIRLWHVKERGWSDIGYHYVIRRDGTVEHGRDVLEVGAHVQGFNHNSIGICLVGGVDAAGHSEHNFTSQQMDSLFSLVSVLQNRWPTAVVQGHRDFPDVTKDCPCFDVKLWWSVRRAYTLNP